ncbi:MAG TPA: ATP-binding protein [Acidobacteriaceae bacterium]|jgi:PAS domain S-box-containing protein|nr:ATP-binding protein [Acidobacteriaceae bacterium]
MKLVKPESGLGPHTHHRFTSLHRVLGYIAAIVLPCLFTILSFRTHALHSTPLALSMASVALITILTGLGPGLTAAIWTTLFFNFEIARPDHFIALGARELTQTAAVLAVSLLITFFFQRQYVIDNRLRIALAKLQAQTDALIEAQQAGSSVAWTFDAETQRIHWAEGGAHIFGRPFDDPLMSELPMDLVMEEDRASVANIFSSALGGHTPFQLQFRSRWANGEVHWLECRGTPSPSNSKIWRGVTIDITDRKQAELALIRSEKLAAIGRLSATIAHEMNNPLEAVTNLLYLSSADTTLPPETRSYLTRADEELKRLASIARHTLTFARPRSSNGPVDIAPIVESVVAMFQPRCSSRGGEIRLLHNPDLRVLVPADDLRQILTNLISNACDAFIGPTGLVEVDISSAGQLAIVEVRDNGAGIAAENLPRIFDPFFTTKEDVGTGIGLWITRELVEKSGGRISVHGDDLPPGLRTMFRAQFPLG